MDQYIELSIYSKIALDMAGRIYHGEFSEGGKIHGRSTLAGEYKVSPETIRRAMNLLEDMGVVTISQGSGIFIKSRKKAYDFIQRFHSKETIKSLRSDIKRLMEQKQIIEKQIQGIVDKIIDYSDRLKHINPMTPMEIEITEGCCLVGRSIIESKFWQNTGGTIVAIRRDGMLHLSPGPYAEFLEGDTILVIGDVGVEERVGKFITDGIPSDKRFDELEL